MTCVSRHHDTTARRLASAETIVLGAARPKTDPPSARPQLTGAPDAPWSVIRIDRPGTYRLAADVVGTENTVGIVITADHVTLDLAGFNVVGKPGSLSGIRAIGARTNISVRNGTVRGWGGHGIDLSDATESHAEFLRVTENAGDGVRLGANSTAVEIQSWSNGRDGLSAGDGSSVRRTCARANSGAGILVGDSGFVRECMGVGNTRQGIQAGTASVVGDCIARHNHGLGIVVGDLASVRDSELIHNDGGAIRAGAGAVIADNRCVPSGAAPSVITTGADSTLQNNIIPGAGRNAA
jgi:hypothetical protein